MSAGTITGVVRIKFNGQLLESEEGAELDIGGDEHEAKMGHKFYGTRSKKVPAMWKFSIVAKADTPVEKLREAIEATAVFSGDNGMKYTSSGMAPSKTLKFKDGAWECEFTGAPAVKMK